MQSHTTYHFQNLLNGMIYLVKDIFAMEKQLLKLILQLSNLLVLGQFYTIARNNCYLILTLVFFLH